MFTSRVHGVNTPVLDNPSESRRSYTSTAHPDGSEVVPTDPTAIPADFDHIDYAGWCAATDVPPTLEQEEQRYREWMEYLEDSARNDAVLSTLETDAA